MKKISFEESQRLWIEYVVWQIFCRYAYPTLKSQEPLSYEEWCKPDMVYIDGVNKVEHLLQYKGEGYSRSQIETFDEWFKKL